MSDVPGSQEVSSSETGPSVMPSMPSNRAPPVKLRVSSSNTTPSVETTKPAEPLVWAAFAVMSVVMAVTVYLMFWACSEQVLAFTKGIDVAVKQPVDYSAIAAYSAGISGAVVKTFSVLLSFVLIFAGAVYVLLPVRAKYQAKGDTKYLSGSLETNSPGLVMVVVGALLAGFSVAHPVSVEYSRTTVSPTATASGIAAGTKHYTPTEGQK